MLRESKAKHGDLVRDNIKAGKEELEEGKKSKRCADGIISYVQLCTSSIINYVQNRSHR